MQIKRMARKLAAISAGALMLGATLTGALAYNLADYPAPFVKNGVLDNTVIVVGAKAATSDVVGAIDVAAALQAEAVTSVPIEGAAPESTVTDGVKVSKSGDKYNYGEALVDVQSSEMDETDLPDLLMEGEFKDTKGDNKGTETYQQSLTFVTSSTAGTFNLMQPDDMDAGDYFEIPKSQDVYTYELEFDDAIEFATDAVAADLEGNSIKIQGNTYTITEVKETSDVVDYIKLVAGDSTVWLAQDQPYTIGDHTVTVVNVDEDGESCGVNVDGQTMWIDQGSTEELGGMSIGVIDVKVVHAKDYDQDTCELTLGSNELILEDSEPVKVNNVELEGSDVTINSVAGEWTGFEITYTSGKEDEGVNSDDIFLAAGGAWTDPVFGNFKLVFGGVVAKTEELKFESTGDNAELTFTNNDGKEIVIPWYYDDGTTTLHLGDEEDDHLLQAGDAEVSGLEDVEGVQLLFVTSGDEAHVLEIDDLDCDNSELTIKDLTYGNTVANKVTKACNVDNQTSVTLSGLGTITLGVSATAVNYTVGGGGNIETKYEGFVVLNDGYFTFQERDGDETTQSTVRVNVTYNSDTDDEEIEGATIYATAGALETSMDTEEGNDDVKLQRTAKGTVFKFDNDEDTWVEITHPEDDVVADVFIAPVKGELIQGGSSSSADRVNPFAVGLAVLDEQAESMTKNMIVVGGPCANTVAFGLMNPTNCADGFEEGKAMLKFFERKGKAALLVAGYDAQDTVNAAYVLAQHNKKYSSKFATLMDEVELVVTDMDQVVFKTA